MMPVQELGALAERLAVEKAEDSVVAPKNEDPPDEQRRRGAAMGRLRAARDVEELAARAAAQRTAAAAERAVWLGASLADLGTSTGHSRQAARKRWPGLGEIYRRRKWLAEHIPDIKHVAGLLDQHARELRPSEFHTEEQLADGLRAVRSTARWCAAEFGAAADGRPTADADPVARWRELDVLVGGHLRHVVEAAGPSDTDQADFALHVTRGLVGYYDHAVAGTDADD
ncbi:hypothetical protein IQ251_19250 [Saccharopolyspora sp. HNM0983]|uniref:Uncharacterized protein n=1 Tax=Saccharopolyspora montiporae TaxID=2781240 RepID=A0A929BD15_9PSEU|nr:hypothetical protein [Saccharopolyspora sp. HNM0983]MBE9376591.1 hypothetical protein [Saccharopolyspora sp. HNM0983]